MNHKFRFFAFIFMSLFLFQLAFANGEDQEESDTEEIEDSMVETHAVNNVNWIEVSGVGLIPTPKSLLNRNKNKEHLLLHQGTYQVVFDFARQFFCEKEVADDGSTVELTFPGMRVKDFAQHSLVKKLHQIKLLKKAEVLKVIKPVEGVVIRFVFYDNKALVKFNKLNGPHRIVLDIFSKEKLEALKHMNTISLQAYNQKNLGEEPRIVLDAGHGGDDLGGVNLAHNIQEKEVALDLTFRVKKLLEAAGCKVFLTRKRDTFVSLLERIEFTEQCRPHLYASIHANASPSPKATGVETYYLDDKRFLLPQTSENFFFAKTQDDFELIAFAESCLAQKINESQKKSRAVHDKLFSVLRSKYQDVVDRGLRTGSYYGLSVKSVPAMILEVGFVTNPIEVKRLKTKEYRELIAHGIADGILRAVS